ncbi:hypothetical protein GCM10010521_22300 [Streptomyces rameus]|uniref:Uncharacterized protein n=1 Tax=Streptomyces rameus TaxID=68261 RepID=A0ABP6N5B1_9ACTN
MAGIAVVLDHTTVGALHDPSDYVSASGGLGDLYAPALSLRRGASRLPLVCVPWAVGRRSGMVAARTAASTTGYRSGGPPRRAASAPIRRPGRHRPGSLRC